MALNMSDTDDNSARSQTAVKTPQFTRLSVNLNKIALLRNQRDVGYPSVVAAGRTVLEAGADGLTVHPRPDGRHIRHQDVHDLSRLIAGWDGDAELNIEGNPFDSMLPLTLEIRPHQATLVPDAPDAKTSDAGWDIDRDGSRVEPAIRQLRDAGIRVSLFMEADPRTVGKAASVGADRVELYTGPYAEAFSTEKGPAVLARFAEAAEAATAAGLAVNAGHDLTLENTPKLKAAIPFLSEVSIGHAITADALWLGLSGAVAAYRAALRK
jgi:pyridoxine 5-phosphate synthase